MVWLTVQSLLVVAAGVALFFLWRRFVQPTRWGWIVTLGFLLRAYAGLALFWVSWLKLPFARSMQAGAGLWFFAVDGRTYFRHAFRAAAGGLEGILAYDRGAPSVAYIQLLAMFTLLFGHVASVALLLNLFAYIGIGAVILRWISRTDVDRRIGPLALVAVSFTPASLLWSLQPLKETFLQLLLVAFFAGAALWQRRWTGIPRRWSAWAVAALVMFVSLYLVAGARWWVGAVLFTASAAFLIVVVFLARERRWAAAVASLVLLLAMTQALRFGAGPLLPTRVHQLLSFSSDVKGIAKVPEAVVAAMENTRVGFELTGGATTIQRPKPAGRTAAGPRVAPATPAPVEPPAVPVAEEDRSDRVAREYAEGVTREEGREGIVAGSLALVVPQTIAKQLGLLDVGGGRGMMWFADLDTVVFDALLLLVVYVSIRHMRSATLRNPLFWLVAMVFAALAVAMAFTVTNFGTLFRLRTMVFAAVAVLPLTLSLAAGEPASES
jgi:hypothetical protein